MTARYTLAPKFRMSKSGEKSKNDCAREYARSNLLRCEEIESNNAQHAADFADQVAANEEIMRGH